MAKLQNIAISGITTGDELREVTLAVEGSLETLGTVDSGQPYDLYPIVYTDSACDYEVYNWSEQDYAHCDLYTLEEFRRKFIKKTIDLEEIYPKEI